MKRWIALLALGLAAPLCAQTYSPTVYMATLTSPDNGVTWDSASGVLGGSPSYVPTVYAAALCQASAGAPWQLCSFSGGGGSMTYPTGSGVAVVNSGSSWGSTLAAPVGTIVGTTDTQTLTNKTVDSVSPTTMAFLDATSSVQTQLNGKQGLFSSQTANTFFAAPYGSAGTPSFRAIVAADIPTLNQNTTGNAATATAFAATPGQCTGSQFATGVTANGTANCSTPAGSGNTTSTSLTTAALPKSNGANSIVNSLFTDSGTQGSYTGTGGFNVPNGPISSGTTPSCGSATGMWCATEASTSGTPTAGYDYIRADSTSHTLKYSVNGSAEATLPSGSSIADTTFTVSTTAVAANSCSTAQTVTMTGLTTSMTLSVTPSTDVSSTTGFSPAGGQLYFTAWPSASNTASIKTCNPTSASITPGASTTWNLSAK